jgi:hypothetical protein
MPTQVVGPAFSAASRDPGPQRFVDIKDYFGRANQPDFPSRFCTRVVVRDVRTGKQALLWSSGKNRAFAASNMGAESSFAPYLPHDTLIVASVGGVPMVSSSNGPPVVLEAAMGFFVQPEPGQVRLSV